MKRFQFLAGALLLSSFALTANANIITNPNFGPANAGVGYGAVAGWQQGPNPSTLAGFPYLTGSNNNSQPFWDNGSAGSTTTVGFVQVYPGAANDTLFQTLTLVSGQTYSFSYLENARSGAAGIVEVLVGGVVITAAHSDPAVGNNDPFRLYTGTFVATGTSEDLVFHVSQANGGDDATALFTNVDVTPVPEPSSLALLGTGVLGVVGMARRKFLKA